MRIIENGGVFLRFHEFSQHFFGFLPVFAVRFRFSSDFFDFRRVFFQILLHFRRISATICAENEVRRYTRLFCKPPRLKKRPVKV